VVYYPGGSEPNGEWIELYNPGNATITLDDYKVGDEETLGGGEGMYRFPVGSQIGAGHVLVIANHADTFIANYSFAPDFELVETDPNVPNLSPYTSWATGAIILGNLGDEVLVLDADDHVIDAVSWGNSTWAFNPSPAAAPAGHSLERKPANIDTDSAADWRDQTNPEPGEVELTNSLSTIVLRIIRKNR
jgi:glycerophosphoryl diester phosphodiesterase